MSHTSLKRITVTVPEALLQEVEKLQPANRSRVVQDALRAYVRHLRRERLRQEADKLDLATEAALAEADTAAGNEVWGEY